MKSSKHTTNLLVGATVLIEWAVRWKSCTNDFREIALAGVRGLPYFGATGTVVSWNPASESGEPYAVLLSNGEVVNFSQAALTVTAPAPDPNQEVTKLLEQILAAIKAL